MGEFRGEKSREGILPGGKSPCVELSGVEFSVWGKFRGGKRSGVNIHGGECSGGETTGVEPSGGNLPVTPISGMVCNSKEYLTFFL